MPKQTVFISYSWEDKSFADILYKDMQYFGLDIIIDKTHAAYRTSVKKYMQLIGKTDYVLLLLSDSFLKSENCMYEALELLNTHELENRILPLLLDPTKIFKADDRTHYYDYWEKEIRDAHTQLIKYTSSDFVEKKRQAQKILSDLPQFLQIISNMFTLKFNDVKSVGYKPLLEVMGIADSDLISKCYCIIFSDNPSQVDIEAIKTKYPNHYRTLEVQGLLAVKNKGDFEMAKDYLQQAVKLKPEDASLNSNYAYILFRLKEYELSYEYYNKSLQLLPDHPETLKGYVNLLLETKNFESAIMWLEKLVDLAPADEWHLWLAQIYRMYKKDPVKSKIHYDAVLHKFPEIPELYHDYATLLHVGFNDIETANKYFEKAVELCKPNVEIFYGYATFLEDAYKDYDKTDYYYKKAIELKPASDTIYLNYSIFLFNNRNWNVKEIIGYLREAERLNPNNALALNYMSRIIKVFASMDSSKLDLVKYYYQKAIRIDNSLVDTEFENDIDYDSSKDYTGLFKQS